MIKHQYYNHLNNGFEIFNKRAKAEIERIKAMEGKIISFKQGRDGISEQFLNEMVEEILSID